MANEIVFNGATGATLYALLFDATGQIYNTALATFGAPGSASWTDYDIPLSEAATATGIYRASMPAVAAGYYSYAIRSQAGATPDVADLAVGSGQLQWSGAYVIPTGISGTMYGTLARLRAEHLTQVPAGATNDALLTQMLESATAFVDSALGFSFAGYAAAAVERAFWRDAARLWLHVPYYEAGTLTGLKHGDTDIADTAYEIEADDHTALFYEYGWRAGRYTATAKWGYGTAPEEIVKVTMQLAVDLWNGRDARSQTNVSGVEGPGQITVQRAFTWQQYQIIQEIRRRYGNTGTA